MAYLTILTEGDETLRKKCRPIDEITPRILTLLDDMAETMHKANGVGLAGPQVGVLRRIVVVQTEPDGPLYEMINPKIIEFSGSQLDYEGCLSIPGKVGVVDRPDKVTVEATDRNGVQYRVTAEGFLARAFCHELDHLDGILYSDKAKRMMTQDELEHEEDD